MYLSAWAEDGRIRQIQADSLESKAVLGNIYVGKVRNVVKNINAAFIEFQKGQMGYLSLNDCKHPIHTDAVIRNDDRVLIGDEIIVQVEKEAVKTKPPTLSAKLDFSGKYIVLSVGGERVSVSRKIRDKEVRQHLHELLEPCVDNTTFGIIARTNSSKANDEELLAETQHLMKRCQDLSIQADTEPSLVVCIRLLPVILEVSGICMKIRFRMLLPIRWKSMNRYRTF